jgi:hypothetical protein
MYLVVDRYAEGNPAEWSSLSSVAAAKASSTCFQIYYSLTLVMRFKIYSQR